MADLLSKKNIESYCPVNKVSRQWSDREKIILEPLFTSYVFVKIEETENSSVRSTDGVLNFVYWLNKPAVIRSEEIDNIKRFLNEFDNIQLEKVSVKPNDTVMIVCGAFMDKKGLVVSMKNKYVKILLPSLGYLMYAEVKTSDIEITSATQFPYPENRELKYTTK